MNKRTNKDRFLIDKKQLIDDVYYELLTSNDPDIKIPYKPNVIKFSPKSVKKIYRIIENVVMYYLKSMDLVEDNAMVEIRPFDGVVLQRWDEPAETKTNTFTGETYTKTARKRFHAYISRYWHRTWNKLNY